MKSVVLMFLIIMQSGCRQDKPINILTIGDSNGASPVGWVYHLGELRAKDKIFNCSVGGNTIGFDNLGKISLNTLANINSYIQSAEDSLKRIDKILIMLGTNDCKAVFDSLQAEVPKNLDKMIHLVKNYPYNSKTVPEIVIITPPPIGHDSVLLSKYFGGQERLKKLFPHYRQISEKYNCRYIDIFSPLIQDFNSCSEDGIHLNETGYKTAAEIINKNLM